MHFTVPPHTLKDQTAEVAQTDLKVLGAQKNHASRSHGESEGFSRFQLDLSCYFLRGLDQEVECLLVAKNTDAASKATDEFFASLRDRPGQIGLVFCTTYEVWNVCNRLSRPSNLITVSPNDLEAILSQRLKIIEFLLRTHGRTRWCLYDITQPARGQAFFGRTEEQKLLLDDRTTNFAICGPGRIGKSSLLLKHKANLLRDDPATHSRCHVIDFFDIHRNAGSSELVAQAIAMKIDPSSRAIRTTSDKLVKFLEWQYSLNKGPLELLCDECDDVCDSDAFEQLLHACRLGYLRMIAAGRRRLFNAVLKETSHACGRLELIRMEPLDLASARQLVQRPLTDLNLLPTDPAEQAEPVEKIVVGCGRNPNLIHKFCRLLMREAEKHQSSKISQADIDCVFSKSEVIQSFLDTYLEISDDATRRLALWIFADGRTCFKFGELIGLARRHCSMENDATLKRRCDELVIQNVLSWHGSGYSPTSPLIVKAAKDAGLF